MGGNKNDLLEPSKFADPANSNSTACSILMTIFKISKWAGWDAEKGLDHSSPRPYIIKVINYSGSRALLLFSLVNKENNPKDSASLFL